MGVTKRVNIVRGLYRPLSPNRPQHAHHTWCKPNTARRKDVVHVGADMHRVCYCFENPSIAHGPSVLSCGKEVETCFSFSE
jgi:hypothetical protein